MAEEVVDAESTLELYARLDKDELHTREASTRVKERQQSRRTPTKTPIQKTVA